MKHILPRIDWYLLAPVVVLLFVGLTTLLSLSPAFFESQLFALVISIIAFVFFTQVNQSFLRSLTIPIYILSILALLIVLFIGFESRGSVRWVSIFGISVQFSEVLKPFLAISFATFLSQSNNKSGRTFILVYLLLAPIAFLIYKQPDLGTALIYVGATVFTTIFFGFPYIWFFASLVPLLVVSPFIWNMLHEYQRQRILTFISPTNDPQGTSYNLIQAIIAVGSGMFIGKGFSQGTQSGLQFLPERQTDFIFASLSEGLGFIGAIIIIIAFLFLGYRLFKICKNADDMFSKIFVACTFFLIFIQFFVNIGMNIGIVPIVGVTLPFVSLGGSSLLSNFILLGIVSAISTGQRRKETLEIR